MKDLELKRYIKGVCKRNGVKIFIKNIIEVSKVYKRSTVGSFVNHWHTYTAVLNDKVITFVGDGYSVENFEVKEVK